MRPFLARISIRVIHLAIVKKPTTKIVRYAITARSKERDRERGGEIARESEEGRGAGEGGRALLK